MYLNSGVDYYIGIFDNSFIITNSGFVIQSPNIKFKLLSYPDLNKVELMSKSGMSENDIYDEIVVKCVEDIIGFPEETIDLEESPAGVIDTLAKKILENSKMILEDLEKTYEHFSTSIPLLDKLVLIVGHYTGSSFDETKLLPVDELIKRYTLCSLSFPNVPPIVFETEVESRVGG